MRVTTKLTISMLTGEVLEHEFHEYQGPVALCDRAAAKQARQQSSELTSQGRQAYGKTNAELDTYKTNLGNFMNFGRDTYGKGGEYQKTQNALANTTAAAGSNAIGADLALNRMRTGENTAGYAPALGEARRSASRDLVDFGARANADRLAKLTGIEQYGVDASRFPVSVQEALYGTATKGASDQIDTAARVPGFMDMIAPQLIQGAATVGAAFCPCAGSMIRMADESEKPVEELKQGDLVWTLSDCLPPNMVLETPAPHLCNCYELETQAGRKHGGSETHTIALAVGGYGYLPELEGQTVLAWRESDVVKSVRPIGQKLVYPIKLNGSHVYLADGIWVMA